MGLKTRVIVGDAVFGSEVPVIRVAGESLVLREVVVLGRDLEVCYSAWHYLPELITVAVQHPDGRGFEKTLRKELGKTLVISASSPGRTGFVPSDSWPQNLFAD